MSSHKPAPPAEQAVDADETFGKWRIIRRDATRKRAVARCLSYSAIREISLVADPPFCCSGSRCSPAVETFAAEAAAAASLTARARHRGRQ
jgi:hypothetical protein